MTTAPGARETPWILGPPPGPRGITELVTNPIVANGPGRRWWIALLGALALVAMMIAGVVWLFVSGVGSWGVNSVIVWGFAIASYVWWIAIGSGGTLISSILVLTRQDWRHAINRFAEAITLFAVAIAGLFPILHLGRPMYFYWLAPYPNTMSLWPQWRSALVWDFWAIVSYLLFSIVFFYVGVLPDLATMRDSAKSRSARIFYGVLAMGWRGSARHWASLETLHKTLAAMGVPMVISVHSIVGLDFAASLMPGWQETIFPAYFVIGALYSGFAMVLVVTAVFRWGLQLQKIITVNHFDAMAKIILAGALLMTCSYGSEWFMAWYGGREVDRSLITWMFTGGFSPLYFILLACNCVLPQALWFSCIRRSIPVLVMISMLILIGMWLERILIIWNTLSHSYMPSQWRLFTPTLSDYALLFGPVGVFVFMFLIFVRVVPAVSIYEMRELARKESAT